MKLIRVIAAVGVVGACALANGYAQDISICENAYQKSKNGAFSSRDEAVKYLEGFQSKCEKDLLFQSRLASNYFVLKRYEEAERIVQAGLRIDTLNKELLFGLGDLRLVQKDTDAAALLAKKMIDNHPKSYGGYYLMQKSLMDAKRFEESIDYGRKAIQIESLPILWLNIGVASYHSKQYQQCVDAVNRAIQMDASVLQRPWGINEALYSLGALDRPKEALELAKGRKQADANWNQDRAFVRVLELLQRH